MSVSLQKGQKISLSKESTGLTKVVVGLGWDEISTKGGFFSKPSKPIDCDASALILTNGKIVSKEDLVYFGKLKHKSGAVNHMGDNLTGAGDGDDEQIKVDLSTLPTSYDRIVFVVNIYDCIKRKQHFGMIENAFIRIYNEANGQELCRYSLTDSYADMTSMIFGEIYRHNNEWKFNALGQATTDPGIGEVANKYT